MGLLIICVFIYSYIVGLWFYLAFELIFYTDVRVGQRAVLTFFGYPQILSLISDSRALTFHISVFGFDGDVKFYYIGVGILENKLDCLLDWVYVRYHQKYHI